MEQNGAAAVDEYIRQYPPETQELLQQVRRAVRQAVPGASEKISYRMPAFDLNGTLIYYAAYQRHIGFYPTASGIEAFREELAGYKTSKGAVQFPIGQALPLALIQKIAAFRADENKSRAEQPGGKQKKGQRKP